MRITHKTIFLNTLSLLMAYYEASKSNILNLEIISN